MRHLLYAYISFCAVFFHCIQYLIIFFSIRFVYGSSSGVHHGGTGGTRNYFVLDAPGEHIWQVSGRSASRVDQLIFSTKDDSQNIRVYGPYGGDGGTSFTTEGTYLKYISGRANKELDRIDFFYDDDCICSEPGFRH